jgi:peptidoglycan/xylan/chitin deacetylase (PgdA/CDA1 family)
MRARAAAVLDRAKVFESLLWMRSRMPAFSRFPILTYHHLRDVEKDYPFDTGVIDASPAAFDEQMEFVARWFTPVGIDEIRAALKGASLPTNAIAVSFDDGYRSNIEIALPILKRHGIRAIFFFATGYLTERRVFWWDRIAYLVKKSRREMISLHHPLELTFDLRTRESRHKAVRTLLRLVKDTKGLDLERLLCDLAIACDVAWDRDLDLRFANENLLTWDQVRELRAAGMDVQSHTRHHRVLGTLSREEARRELRDSRMDLERELGERIYAVSYPVGADIEGNAELIAAVHDAGYELGFASHGGMNVVQNSREKPLHFARIALDYGTPMSLFRGTLALPRLVVSSK